MLVKYLFLGRAATDAGAVVLEQVCWARFNASGSVSVLALRVDFPRVCNRIVTLHSWTLLLTDAIIEKVTTRLIIFK